ncbi:Cyclin-dependent kinase [Handroanthus impetiginosus]|uniref:Cyclin-dependent kinase n=1 Tax=Handroanthus impetiginosus TaxID=429701 RepID=A0A2G9I168_9LAMI|nr:Cyclin-dependent kinase [Handroanthus impetiginosus]
MMLLTAHDYLSLSSKICFVREFKFKLGVNYSRPRVGGAFCKATLITNSDSFEVGRLIGSYGFMNITSYSGLQSGMDREYWPADLGRLKAQDVGEGSVKIRLYEGRIAQGPLRGTPVIFKVYPGQQVGGVEADLMAANELTAHASLQGDSKATACPNIQTLLGGFETKTGEQWLAFRNDGKYTASDYVKVASEKMSKDRDLGGQKLWNPFEKDETIKRRRYFVTKLLQGAFRGLVYMHDHDRLHQSLGPASIVLNTMVEKDAAYLVPRLRDLAFSVDIRYSELEGDSSTLSEGLWRRASAAGAFTPMEKRAFGIADDMYEAGLLFAYMAFIPFCEAGVMDSLSLRRLLENTFQLDVQAMREYCLADDRLHEAVKFLDLGNGAGWELLQAMLSRDFRQRPIAEAVLNHRFMAGAFL